MNENNNISFPVIIELDEDGVFIVSCPVFKGCHSYGYTIDEAISNITEAIELCMEEDDFSLDNINKYVGLREINFSKSNQRKFDCV